MQQQASRQKRNLKVDLGKCVQMYRAVAVFGTGEPGSRPGRHFFMTRGVAAQALEKK